MLPNDLPFCCTGASDTTRQPGKSPTIRGGDQPPPCDGVISEARRSRPLCPQKWLVSLADASGSSPPHPTPPRSSNLSSLETAPPHGTPFNPSNSRPAQGSNWPASQTVRAAQLAICSVQTGTRSVLINNSPESQLVEFCRTLQTRSQRAKTQPSNETTRAKRTALQPKPWHDRQSRNDLDWETPVSKRTR